MADRAGNSSQALFKVVVRESDEIGKMAGSGRVFDGPTKVTFYLNARVNADGTETAYLLLQVCRHNGVVCVGAPKKFKVDAAPFLQFVNDSGVVPSGDPVQVGIADTVMFAGTGSWNDAPGHSYSFKAVDTGDAPGPNTDMLEVTVTAPDGTTIVSVRGNVAEGNVEAKPGN